MEMKIGGFEVGNFIVKERGGKKHLLFDCRDCVYSSSLADDKACRYHVLYALRELDADLVVLAEVYERVYEEKQVKLLKELASLIQKLESESVWSYAHLGDPNVEDEAKFGERHDLVVRIAHDLLELFVLIGALLQ